MLRTREKYDKLVRAVPKHVLDDKTKVILDDFGKFFREFPDVSSIEHEPFWLWFKSFAHPKLTPDAQALYETYLRQVQEPVPPELEAGLMERLVAADTASKLVAMVEKWNEGDEINLGSCLRTIVEQFELDTNRKVKTPWVQDDIAALLAEDQNDTGFKWRIPELNMSMRPLRSGDFLIVAARPDVGKTTFGTDQFTHFASQVEDVFPGQGRSILWFNNEGPGNRIVKRAYQSALNSTIQDLMKLTAEGTIHSEYVKATGRPDTLRVFDIHDFWNHEIEDIVRQFPPAMLVFDMIDNIKFGGAVNNNGQRTDQLLEAMYQWARVMGVKHDCPVIAMSQVSADGEGMQFPTLSMLKDSKTGKQGAADAILTIGYQPDFPDTRYLGLTKNKLAREGGPKDPRASVIFDGLRGRYRSITEVTHD